MYTILTINTWKCDGDYQNRINALIYKLKIIKPDIILLQESFQSTGNEYNTTTKIADELDMEHFSSLSRPRKRLVYNKYMDSYSNVSILSKYAYVKRCILSLPSNPDDGGREAVMTEIQLAEKSILVGSLHLSHLRDADTLRRKQLMYLLNCETMQGNYSGILIGGDYNMEISDDFFEAIKNEGHILTETFRPEPDMPVYTLNKGSHKIKIDHILEVQKKQSAIKVYNSRIVFEEPCTKFGVKISDHNGVLLNFSVQ